MPLTGCIKCWQECSLKYVEQFLSCQRDPSLLYLNFHIIIFTHKKNLFTNFWQRNLRCSQRVQQILKDCSTHKVIYMFASYMYMHIYIYILASTFTDCQVLVPCTSVHACLLKKNRWATAPDQKSTPCACICASTLNITRKWLESVFVLFL